MSHIFQLGRRSSCGRELTSSPLHRGAFTKRCADSRLNRRDEPSRGRRHEPRLEARPPKRPRWGGAQALLLVGALSQSAAPITARTGETNRPHGRRQKSHVSKLGRRKDRGGEAHSSPLGRCTFTKRCTDSRLNERNEPPCGRRHEPRPAARPSKRPRRGGSRALLLAGALLQSVAPTAA